MPDLYDGDPVTIDEQIAAADRELRYRDRVYLRLIERGTMTQDDAALNVRQMKAIRQTLVGVRDYGLANWRRNGE